MAKQDDNIDFVIIWVDGSDPEWLEQYSYYNVSSMKKE